MKYYSELKTIEQIKLALEDPSFSQSFNIDVLDFCELILDPSEKDAYVYDINQATVVGLYTKMVKYFKLIINAYDRKEYDTIVLFGRPIYEAFVTMKYLIKKGENSQRHFRLVSYRRRYKNYKELSSISGIGEVINAKTDSALVIDGFSIQDLEGENTRKGRKWELDGKTFSQIHEEVENAKTYAHVYGPLSEVIHSGWGDIRQLHLIACEGDYFIPNLEFYNKMDIRLTNPIVAFMLESSLKFLQWSERIAGIDALKVFKRVNDLITLQMLDTYENEPEKYLND